MRLLIDLLREDSRISSLRAMSLLTCVLACLIACYGVYKGADLTGLSALCGVFLAAAFGGKVVQKSVELKVDRDEK